MTAPVVGFAGLTHLGLVSATAAASKGFRTIGYDADSTRVREIAAGRLPIMEPDLDELARRCSARLCYTDKVGDLRACDIVYIATDVPTDVRGQSDLSGISRLIEEVIPALGPDALLCVLCQVPPGFTRALPLDPQRLFYQVETLVFGRAVERATKPERFIVGCNDPARPLPQSYAALLGAFECPILPMRYESAELAKIAINCCLVASVSVANTLADLSERIGADWNEIVPALRLDRRIGAYSYLAPGLGIAGGNLERDLATVLRTCRSDRQRSIGDRRVHQQQPLPPRLGAAADPSGSAATCGAADIRDPRVGLQGKYPFHEEFAVARAHRASAAMVDSRL